MIWNPFCNDAGGQKDKPDGDAYRAVYTVRFREVFYVLHAFQKKSKQGIATPQHEIEKIKARLKRAEEEYQVWKKRNP
jgi:phage-related protein